MKIDIVPPDKKPITWPELPLGTVFKFYAGTIAMVVQGECDQVKKWIVLKHPTIINSWPLGTLCSSGDEEFVTVLGTMEFEA